MIIGHQKLIEYFERALMHGKLSHAYIFVGSKGSGKKEVVDWLINRLYDGHKKGPNPDLRVIQREEGKKEIAIEQIRNLRQFVQQKSFSGSYKIIIIEGVENMSTPAVNALLKTLEEPAGQSLLILTAEKIYKIPATIISRCQLFKLMNTNLLQNEEKAREFISLLHGDINDRFAYVAQLFGSKASLTEQTIKSMASLKNWQIIARDLLLLEYGLPDKITYKKHKEELVKLSQKFETTQIVEFIKSINHTRDLLNQNVNPRLALENLLLKL